MPKIPRTTGVKDFSLPKSPKISTAIPKMPGALKTKPFDFSKLAKAPKFPKSPRVKIIKSVIKKFKK